MNINYYNQIHGWFDFADIYDEAISKTPNGGVLVEIGTFLGKSLCYMLEASHESQKDLSIYSCDLFKITPDAGEGQMPWGENARIWEKNNGGEDALLFAFQKNVASCPGNHLLKKSIRSNSWDGALNFQDKSVDFAFIDASHLYPNVKKDLESWYPKMKNQSIIAGHDYNNEVERAVHEFFHPKGIKIHRRTSSWIAYL